MEFDKVRHYVTLHSLCEIIQNNGELGPNSKIYIKWAREFFGEISKTLVSMLNPQDGGGYYFMEPPITDVFANYGKDISKMSVHEIEDMKKNFESISNNLEKFEVDASGFYKTQEAKKTFNFLIKLLPKDVGFSAYDLFGEPTLEGDD
jgi:hypothetical protein